MPVYYALTMNASQTDGVHATVLNTSDNVNWRSEDNSICDVTFSADGREATLVAKGIGSTNVHATCDSAEAIVAVTITAAPPVISLTFDAPQPPQ